MNVVLFEDEIVERLYPITVGRPAYAISCGGRCLLDLIQTLDSVTRWGLVRTHLSEWQSAVHGLRVPDSSIGNGLSLWINARLLPSRQVADALRRTLAVEYPCAVRDGDRVLMALCNLQSVPIRDDVDKVLSSVTDRLERIDLDLPTLDDPHDVIRHHLDTFADNLTSQIERGSYQEVAEGVFAAGQVKLGHHVVTDTRAGPIVLEPNVTVGPFTFLRGPIHLGRDATVLEHASIKSHVSVGGHSKIGGEVVKSIIESYSNKQHHGFLGHSYLGSWVNLGAGTSNSDLKNTYGTIRMDYARGRVETGMQFMGCVLGDYAKSAINTTILTGNMIGVCSMIYGSVTTNVPSFVNYARSFGQVKELPVDVAAKVQERMYARRGLSHGPVDSQLIKDMYALTCSERESSPLKIESGMIDL